MDWEIIVLLAVIILGFLGAWAGFKRLINEMRDLLCVIADAIQDDTIDNAEITKILKEARDVGKAFLEVVKLFCK